MHDARSSLTASESTASEFHWVTPALNIMTGEEKKIATVSSFPDPELDFSISPFDPNSLRDE